MSFLVGANLFSTWFLVIINPSFASCQSLTSSVAGDDLQDKTSKIYCPLLNFHSYEDYFFTSKFLDAIAKTIHSPGSPWRGYSFHTFLQCFLVFVIKRTSLDQQLRSV